MERLNLWRSRKGGFVKRVFDIAFSMLFLLLLFPLMALLAILVKSTSKGPLFYKAKRIGFRGEKIVCLKFRTMRSDANEILATLLEDPKLKMQWQTIHKLKNDPRVTKVGKILRKFSLDELPQLWNVLMGTLSIVGPRPIDTTCEELLKEETRRKYEKILSIKPGLTCLWQVNGRNQLTFEERTKLEEQYVEKQSFWLDLQIISKTVYILLLPKGAF